jgi:hypothetical protein
MLAGWTSQSRVEPARSVKRRQTVPAGGGDIVDPAEL